VANPLIDRVQHLHRAVLHPLWLWIYATLLGALGTAAWLRDEFMPAKLQAKFKVMSLLPHLSFAWWVVAVLTGVVGVLVEGSFRIARDQAARIKALEGVLIDEPGGWSLTIETSGGSTGILTGDGTGMIAFQQFRFKNVSKSISRQLDVEIFGAPEAGRNERLLFRSTQDGRTKYQSDIENKVAANRNLRCIAFPVRLDPFDMAEGQIIIPVPAELTATRGNPKSVMEFVKTVSFVFHEHISGRDVRLYPGQKFDALKGQIEG
jgi:hypothetical protein